MAALIGAAERAWSFHFSIIKSQSRLAHLWKWSSGRPIKGLKEHFFTAFQRCVMSTRSLLMSPPLADEAEPAVPVHSPHPSTGTRPRIADIRPIPAATESKTIFNGVADLPSLPSQASGSTLKRRAEAAELMAPSAFLPRIGPVALSGSLGETHGGCRSLTWQ
jgi:hypothetical protein